MAAPVNPKDQTEQLKELQSKIDALTKSTEKYEKQSTRSYGRNVKSLKYVKDIMDGVTDEVRDMDKSLRKLHLDGALKTGPALALQDELKKINREIEEIGKLKTIEGKITAFKQLNVDVNRVSESINTVSESINTVSESSKSFNDLIRGGDWASVFNKAGDKLSTMPGMLKSMGGAAKGMGSILGKVSGQLAGWPGLVLMAVKKIWDLGMAADQFVKDANKSFAMIRGPDIMTSDIKGQFKSFNSQIYSMSENLRVGMNVQQVREFFDAVAQTGSQIQNLSTNLYSYRDAVYIAAKASASLGIAVPQVGSMMSEMITDYRMSLESVDKAFVQMSFDAKKSGLSTDRFWTAVKNSAASLAMYGNAIGSASKTMKRFTQDQIGGADQAAKAVENMYDVFKDGSTTTARAIMGFIEEFKPGHLDKVFDELSKSFSKKALNLNAQVDLLQPKLKGAKNKEEEKIILGQIEKLNAEMVKAQLSANRAAEMVGKNSVIQAGEISSLADRAPEFLVMALKGMTMNSKGLQTLAGIDLDQLQTLYKAGEVIGLSKESIDFLRFDFGATKQSIQNLYKDSKNYFTKDEFNTKKSNDLTSSIDKSIGLTGDDQIKAQENIKNILETQFDMDKNAAQLWSDIILSNDDNARNISSYIKKGDEKSLNALDSLVRSNETADATAVYRFKAGEMTQNEMASMQDKTFKDIRDQTLSYNEMLKIAEEDIRWKANSLGFLQGINSIAFDIFKFMTKGKEMTTEQKHAQRMVETLSSSISNLPKIKRDMSGNITSQSQVNLTEKVSNNIVDLEGALSKKNALLEEAKKKQLDLAAKGEKDVALNKLVDEAQKSSDDMTQDLTNQKDMLENLKKLNRNNELIARYTISKAKGDKGFMKDLVEDLRVSSSDPGFDLSGAIKAIGLSPSDLKSYTLDKSFQKKLEEITPTATGQYSGTIINKGMDNSDKARQPKKKATLQDPTTITRPGSVILDPGEIVLPKRYSNLGTIPSDKTNWKNNNSSNEGQNISINVTATERDLAQKIANEVRAVLYKNSLNGQG